MNHDFRAGVAKSVTPHMQMRFELAGLVAHCQPRPPIAQYLMKGLYVRTHSEGQNVS